MPIIVLHNQTIIDIAIQYFGTAEAAFDIALMNQLSITDDIEPGQILHVPNLDYGSTEIVKYFLANKKQPATALMPTVEVTNQYEYEFPQGEFPISF